jgi:hypothetical protein
MTDIVIVIERKRHDEGHWIKPAPPTGNTEQQYRVWFDGKEIGVWRVPSCSAARWLLANGKAERSDTLRTRRLIEGEEVPCMKGAVGWFADRTVDEGDSRDGTPRWVKWRPMPEGAIVRRGGRVKPASEDFSDAE